MSLTRIEQSELLDEYDRRRLDDLSDTALVGLAAAILGRPLAGDEPAISFVLHAPLELLARSELLAYVAPGGRRLARLRIVSLACGYESAGRPLDPPDRPFDAEPAEALARLGAAVAAGDLEVVDDLAASLAGRCSAREISAALAEHALAHLGAAGHANIYLDLSMAGRTAAVGPSLIWPMARELTKAPGRTMSIPVSPARSGEARAEGIGEGLSHLDSVGPAGSSGIAAMVEYAEKQGVFSSFFDGVDSAVWGDPYRSGRELLRCAALMMLQGPPEHAPDGWTHCLTLPQAALAQGGDVSDPARGAPVAAGYVAAHWSTLCDRPFDPRWIPEPFRLDVAEAFEAGPAAAASATWHAPEEDLAGIEQDLATRAAAAHDAHHVKYSLACLRAAASDPPARRLFLAAAAHLCARWIAHPDRGDPLAGLIAGSDSPQAASGAAAMDTVRS